MKFSTVLVSSLFCVSAVAGKKHGLRRTLQTNEQRKEVSIECLGYFSDMDGDGDNVLSMNDIKNVLVYLIDKAGVDESEVRTFAHDLSNADLNDNGQIEKVEFMNACTAGDYDASNMKKHAEKKAEIEAAEEKAKKEEFKKDFLAAMQKSANIKLADAHKKAKEETRKKVMEAQEEAKKNLYDAAVNVVKMAKGKTEKKARTNLYDAIEEVVAIKHEHENKDAEKKKLLAAAKEVAAIRKERDEKNAMNDVEDHTMDLRAYSEADVTECKGFFKTMDIDGDGELSVGDLETVIDSKVKQHVDEAELREFVESVGKADLNNDDIISKKEFMSACLND